MNSLGERALMGLALLGTIVVMVLTLYVMKLKVDRAESQLEVVSRQAKELAQDRDQLTTTLTEQRAAQARLQTTQHNLRREIDVRKRRIQELEDENADLKAWASQPLPAAARRLRQRPVITGAAAYREWLSRGNALPAAVDRPTQ